MVNAREDTVSVLDLPATEVFNAVIVPGVCNTVVIPAIPPFVSDDEPFDLQQCPTCQALITVEDAGISYCYRCGHLIFVGDALDIVQAEPNPFHCPLCGGVLDENDCEWTGRGWFFCRLCGQTMDWSEEDCDAFQIRVPDQTESNSWAFGVESHPSPGNA
jgi:hypothetical protein